MADIDAKTNEYMSESEHFADLFNYYVYNGRQVIDPDKLQEMDRTSLSIIYGDDTKSSVTDEDYRDVIKLLTIKADDNATYMLLGLEDQTHVHYAMPVRDMLYDARSYAKQVKNISRRHRLDGDNGTTSDEFLSGFHKDDKIHPVITLVLYWSGGEWDGPTSIYETLDTDDNELLRLIPNYRINLISPSSIRESDFAKFKTTLAEVLQYIKHSRNKNELDKALNENEQFRHLDRESADLLNTVTHSNLKFEEGKEEVDVCLAVKEMREESEAKVIVRTIDHMVKEKGMTVSEACDLAGYAEEEYYSARKLIQSSAVTK